MPNVTTNNSFATATLLNGVTADLVENQLIRSSDPALDNSSDFYKFQLNGVSNLKVNLTAVKGDVKLSIYQSLTGQVPTNADTPLNIRVSNTLRISDSYTSTADPALANLPAGTYYVKVELGSNAPDGNYNLLVNGSSEQTTNSILWRDPSGSLKSWQLKGGTIVASSTFDANTPLQVPTSLEIVSTGDFDADGVSDILWRDTATATMRVWLMANGTQVREGGNVALQDSTGQPISRQSQWIIGATGDIDGDKSTDIVWRNTTSGEVVLWFMNGNIVAKETDLLAPGISVGADWKIVGFSNADNQQGNDLLWRNSISNQLAIWTLSRNGLEAAGTRILEGFAIGQDWQVVAYKDFNRDGVADFLWQNKQTAQIALWKMSNGSTYSGGQLLNGVSSDYRLIGTEDLTGKGRPNPLWWNTRTGSMNVWTIADDGTSVTTGKDVLTETGGPLLLSNLTGEWNPEAFQDWDGDGKADLLWRNVNSGILYYWKMDGNIYRGGSIIKDASLPNAATTLASNFVTTGLNYGAYRTTNVLQVKSAKFSQDTAGTARLSPFNIGVLEGRGSFNDSVGGPDSSDKEDWYTFTVETPSFLTDLVSNATSPNASSTALKAEVYLEGVNGPIVTGIDSVLEKGTYLIKVSHSTDATSNVPTPYTLTFAGKVGITNINTKVSGVNGYGLVLSKSSIDLTLPNNTIDVTSFKFENDGDVAANNVEVGFYLSKNGTFETTDRRIALTSTTGQTITDNLWKGSVARGQVVTLSGLRLTLPSQTDPFWDTSGKYSIIAMIDPRKNLISENREDNFKAATLTTIGIGNADLLGTEFTVGGSTTIRPGATISGTFKINNKGSRSTGVAGQLVRVKFYVSANSSISRSEGDYLAGEVIIPATEGITPGETRTGTYSFVLPAYNRNASPPPTDWDRYWDSLTNDNTTAPALAYVGMDIEFVNDADNGNNANLGVGLDKAITTVSLV